jgi:hypothetical protein
MTFLQRRPRPGGLGFGSGFPRQRSQWKKQRGTGSRFRAKGRKRRAELWRARKDLIESSADHVRTRQAAPALKDVVPKNDPVRRIELGKTRGLQFE